jgi:hypothetical protein
MRYVLWVVASLLCLSLLGWCFLWFLTGASSHNIPVKTYRFLAAATLVNVGLLWLVLASIRRGKRTERQQQEETS